MGDAVDYQVPLPDGRSLRFWQTPDTVRISRDTVPRSRLRKEALLPVVMILLTALSLGVCVWRLWHPSRLPIPGLPFVFVIIMAAVLVMFAYIMRGFRQNTGVVTEISITRETLYWRKETIFGRREYIWPLSTVKWVEVDRFNRMLKIRRRRGAALGAFAIRRLDELENAANLLNEAIKLYRDGPKADGAAPTVQS